MHFSGDRPDVDQGTTGQYNTWGYQELFAMDFALAAVNADTQLLPDLSLVAKYHDSETASSATLSATLDAINDQAIAVIGEDTSALSIAMQNLLRLFHIPQIGFSATSAAMSNKNLYDYFLRVVPPDSFQARAMLTTLRALGVRYAGVIAVNDVYGQPSYEVLTNDAPSFNISVSNGILYDPLQFSRNIDGYITKLYQSGVPVVIAFRTFVRSPVTTLSWEQCGMRTLPSS